MVSSDVANPRVYPFGLAVAITVCPTAPLPPVRLTTFTGTPSTCLSRVARIRETASVPPPAPQGQISVIGRRGYFAAKALDGPRLIIKETLRRRAANVFDFIGASEGLSF
jgi:hypothetical protein